MRQAARRKVPRAFFEYADGGAYSEQTLRANRADLEAIKLRQRILVDVSARSTATTILGEPASLPLSLCWLGYAACSMVMVKFRLPRRAGGRHSVHAVDHVHSFDRRRCRGGRQAVLVSALCHARPRFYPRTGGARRRGQMQRAGAHRRSASARPAPPRHQERHDAAPPEVRFGNLIDIATKLAWAWSVLRGKRKTFGNIAGHVRGMESVTVLSKRTAEQFDPTLSWKDVEWIKSSWPGKLILKGILDVEDARIAAKTGAAAIVVSNHGGRQLDGAASSIAMLPPIVEALGSELEIMFDGGIRSGQDVMRAHRARRALLHERPRLHLRSRRRRGGRRRPRHRDHPQRARHQHGADRRQQHRRDRPARDHGGLAALLLAHCERREPAACLCVVAATGRQPYEKVYRDR